MIASGVLLIAVIWEFKLGGENNIINIAFFIPLFAILLKAIISVLFNYIVRFLCLYSDI